MNGPSHYREAEKLLARADTARADVVPALVAMAQVHAALATAAAAIDAAYSYSDSRNAWTQATS